MSEYVERLRDRLRNRVGQEPIILVGASVLARDEKGRILFQNKDDSNGWALPGGTMNLGETIKETACRKLYEDTGIKANNLKLAEIFSGEEFHSTNSDGKSTYNLIVLYKAYGIKDDLLINKHEIMKAKYFYPEEISNLETRSVKILNRLGIVD
ncbi:MAG: NUDIX domain-containing protein [Halarsenatibacteraceae bacterium]